MKFFKNKTVAMVIMAVAIMLSVAFGVLKAPATDGQIAVDAPLDTSLNGDYFRRYILDEADVLSESTEEQMGLYNANWDEMMGGIIGVVTVDSFTGSIDDAAWEYGNALGLGENDAVLFLDAASGEYTVQAYGRMYDLFAAQPGSFVDSHLYGAAADGDYDSAALSFFAAIHPLVYEEHDHSAVGSGDSAFVSIFGILLLVAVIIVAFTVIDGIRYSSWNARYGRVLTPPVVYRPILWWHRPGTSWYKQRRSLGGKKPGGKSGGMRPPMGGVRPPKTGSGSSKRPGGTFSSGGSRGGSFGGGSRGGSFGGRR